MTLSKDCIEALSDLIENRLSVMEIGDQDDLRERMKLQRALAEIQGITEAESGVLANFADIPRRGRRRKVGALAG
jgi:hypothetical protein